MSESISSGLLFIGIYSFIILLPCVGISIMGYRMIEKIGHHPSKTPAIQMSIIWKLIVIEILSLACLLTVYHALVDYSSELGKADIFMNKTKTSLLIRSG